MNDNIRHNAKLTDGDITLSVSQIDSNDAIGLVVRGRTAENRLLNWHHWVTTPRNSRGQVREFFEAFDVSLNILSIVHNWRGVNEFWVVELAVKLLDEGRRVQVRVSQSAAGYWDEPCVITVDRAAFDRFAAALQPMAVQFAKESK